MPGKMISCDDPLVAILGQLSDHFKGSSFDELTQALVKEVVPLLKANFNGVLNRFTGFTLDASAFKEEERDLLNEYTQQRETKEELKRALARLSAKVVEETGNPLVFIIDELDRCRPTFAIELLERVKHIFDVQDIVFVLGINRDELCNSLKSVYGEIEAGTYLRRFFDMEFNLPLVDSEQFTEYLMQKHELKQVFQALADKAGDTVHSQDLHSLETDIPALWKRLGLTMRDIEYCVRMIALAGKTLRLRQHALPYLLGLLIPLKLKNPSLYKEYIDGNRLGSQVIDHIDEFILPADLNANPIDPVLRCEVYFYLLDSRDFGNANSGNMGMPPPALEQLLLFKDKQPLTRPEYLPVRIKSGPTDSTSVSWLIQQLQRFSMPSLRWDTTDSPLRIVQNVARLIDFAQS